MRLPRCLAELTGISLAMTMPVCAQTTTAKTLSSGSPTPVGYWTTVDDDTGRAQSVMRIWETSDKTLAGQIVKTYPDPSKPSLHVCSACRDERKNQPILGMVIMKKFKHDEGNALKWSHGEILDPTSGRTYHCYLEVVEGGKKLKVRGYIGISLLGRTQYWVRDESGNT